MADLTAQLTTNKNLAQNSNFMLVCKRMPNVEYFIQKTSIPAIQVNSVSSPSPFSPIKLHGTGIRYQPLNVRFLLDEDLNNYIEMYNWVVSYAHPEKFEQYEQVDPTVPAPKDLHGSKYTDISIHRLSNKNNPNVEFIFHNAHPTDIDAIDLDVGNDDPDLSCSVTFEYDYMTIRRVTG